MVRMEGCARIAVSIEPTMVVSFIAEAATYETDVIARTGHQRILRVFSYSSIVPHCSYLLSIPLSYIFDSILGICVAVCNFSEKQK